MRPLTGTRQTNEGRDKDKDTIRIKPVAVFGEWQHTCVYECIPIWPPASQGTDFQCNERRTDMSDFKAGYARVNTTPMLGIAIEGFLL